MIIPKGKVRDVILRVVYFFPFQLLLAHLKRNHILLFFWFVAVGLVTQTIANKYGLPQLLLYPEYLGNVNFLSHVILGLTGGAFIMAFNMSSYIINGFRFQFIATLSKPFLKYCLNNFLFPLTFYGFYIYNLYDYQLNHELVSLSHFSINLFGFIAGNTLFITISMLYFVSTNKSVFEMLPIPKSLKSKKYRPIYNLIEPDLKWYQFLKRKSDWKIETYIAGDFSIRRARSIRHYKRETLKKVFQQNHLNASFFEIGAIVSILVLGWFMEVPFFEIPAGASILLLLSMILMFSGALHNWLKGWSILGFVFIFLVANEISKNPSFRIQSQAFGMNYESPRVYSNEELNDEFYSTATKLESFNTEVERLNKLQKKVGLDKTLCLVNTSGGGLRSALWTFHVLQSADSILSGALFHHTSLITGASGGMIGSSYYRELFLRNELTGSKEIVSSRYTDMMSKDILNPMAFAWVVNDFFFRFRKVDYQGQQYMRDRGYYFEQQLVENTEEILDVPVSYYDQFVNNGVIPDILLAPTITNDGRKMIISSINTSFLHRNSGYFSSRLSMIDFRSFFNLQNASQLRYTSALRMNATFPYVLPGVTLPSVPRIEVMDAGVRDNFGFSVGLEYLNSINSWIDTAIDKIIIVRIIDNKDEIKIQNDPYTSLFTSVSNPVGSVYENMFNVQRLNQEEQFSVLDEKIKKKLEIITFKLDLGKDNKIPLSWHLSTRDKAQIKNAIRQEANKKEMQRLISFFN